jgi:hypothetical protein
MSFKRIICLGLILAIAHCELTFLQQADNNGNIKVDFTFTRKCDNRSDCVGLTPPATECFKVHDTDEKGWCTYRKGQEGRRSNKFNLP